MARKKTVSKSKDTRRRSTDEFKEEAVQMMLVSISRSVQNWQPAADGPPFRARLYRIAHNECLKTITRRKLDAAAGPSSVQSMLFGLPEQATDTNIQLLHESRMEAFRWASEKVRHEFTLATWAMFWQSTGEERSINEVARNRDRSTGAISPPRAMLSVKSVL